MGAPHTKKPFTHYLGNALLGLFGLGLAGAAIIASFVDLELPDISSGRQWGRRHLKGPVREIVTEEVTVSAAGDTSSTRTTESTTYDCQGNRMSFRRDTVNSPNVESRYPDQETADTSLDVPIFDSKHGFRLLMPEDETWDSRLPFHYTFSFDDLYRYERYVMDETGRLLRWYIHNEHPSGRITAWTRFTSDGRFDGRETTTYNERGDRLEQERYAADGKLEYHYTYVYNEQGDLAEMASLDDEGVPRQQLVFVYEYDEWDNWTQRTMLRFNSGAGVEASSADRIVTSRKITYY